MHGNLNRWLAIAASLGLCVTPSRSDAAEVSAVTKIPSTAVAALGSKPNKKDPPKDDRAAIDVPASVKLPQPAPEPWSEHFSVTEMTPGGHAVPLSNRSLQTVDLRSRIVIERTSKSPEKILVRDDYKDENNKNVSHKKHFGVKVWVNRPDSQTGQPSKCEFMVTVPGLNRSSGKRTRGVVGCNEPTTINLDTEVTHGMKFEIDTSRLRHGDRVNVSLLGDEVEQRLVTASEGCEDRAVAIGSSEPSSEKKKVCPAGEVTVPGRDVTYELVVYDYQGVEPYENVGRGNKDVWELRQGSGKRFDVDNALAIWMENPSTSAPYRAEDARKHVHIEATAKKGNAEPHTVECPLDGRFPTCKGFEDEEEVTIVATRPLVIDGKAVDEEIARFRLEAAGLGLHYLPAGSRRAYYSTATMFAVEWNDDTPQLTFAQTLGYSLYWKHRTKLWVEGISAGAHLSILGDPDETAEGAEDDDQTPVSFGIGGQMGVGRDALQIGGGYDVLNRRPYFVIGIGIPDAVALGKRLRKK